MSDEQPANQAASIPTHEQLIDRITTLTSTVDQLQAEHDLNARILIFVVVALGGLTALLLLTHRQLGVILEGLGE